jgi:imidazolonepropionase-like amidohydrolase
MTKAIFCGTLIDGTGGPALRDAVVLVEGGTVTELGPASRVPIPPEAERIDLGSCTVLPGLIDCHTHLAAHFGDDPQEVYPEPELYQMLKSVRNMRWDLRCGLTTVRNPSEKSYRALAVRHAIEKGLIAGPRIITGLRGIRTTHGWGQNAFGFDGVEDLRRAVRENLAAGADFIKIYATGENFNDTAEIPYLTREEIFLCADEAHRAGVRIAAHAHGGPGLRDCIEAGVDTIEHGTMIAERDIALFIDHGATLITTFNPYFHETTLATGRSAKFTAGVTKAQENMRKVFPIALKSGMKYAAGSDSRHGNFVFELEMYRQMGLTCMEAVCACTRKSAEALDILAETGTLEAGKAADLIAVAKDPLRDISALREVAFVMKGGQVFDLSAL